LNRIHQSRLNPSCKAVSRIKVREEGEGVPAQAAPGKTRVPRMIVAINQSRVQVVAIPVVVARTGNQRVRHVVDQVAPGEAMASLALVRLMAATRQSL